VQVNISAFALFALLGLAFGVGPTQVVVLSVVRLKKWAFFMLQSIFLGMKKVGLKIRF
jgi:hypothetical protein